MIRRNVTDHLLQALTDTPVVLVNGARQTGKSTLVKSSELTARSRQYLTFDDPGVLAAVKRDTNGFVAGLAAQVTLDEVQHAPELFPAIKVAVDRRREPGRFLLTGSSCFCLSYPTFGQQTDNPRIDCRRFTPGPAFSFPCTMALTFDAPEVV